jgi:hypothetical protein
MLALSLHRLWRRTFLDRFPAAVRAVAACCKLSFALRPGLSRENRERTKERTNEIAKGSTQRKRSPVPYTSSADAMKECVGRNSGSSSPPVPSSSASALRSSSRSLRSRSSHSDVPLRASSSAGVGTSLPTSVVERKSSPALLHVSLASRSRTFQRLFHLPVSFLTSAHKIFCWAFYSEHCSRVCVLQEHYQH